jgi:threonine dehydratase
VSAPTDPAEADDVPLGLPPSGLFHLVARDAPTPSGLKPIAPTPFVHLSTGAQLAATARRHFRGRLVDALELDPARLVPGALVYEDTTGHGAFPHHYGAVPTDAIRARHALPPVTRADVVRALAAVRARFAPTPLVAAPTLSARLGVEVWLKLDTTTPTRVFKARGAANALAALAQGVAPPRAVVTASGGNHGISVAWAARAHGIGAHVFVPAGASAEKRAAIAHHGARVVTNGVDYQAAADAAHAFAAAEGLPYVHAYDDPDVIAGQGTLALELEVQVQATLGARVADAIDAIYLGVGGGGLVAGVAAALGARASIVAVEPEGAPTLHAARTAGHMVTLPAVSTIADGLAARRVGGLALDLVGRAQVRSVLVDDAALLDGMATLLETEQLLVEPAGAAALAGLVTDRRAAMTSAAGGRVVLVLCGANIARVHAAALHATVAARLASSACQAVAARADDVAALESTG